MSITQLLQIGRRGMLTYKAAMNTVGQNVANVNTEGYTRRQLNVHSDSVISKGIIMRPSPNQATGTGVSIQSYERVRDRLLQHAVWESHTALGGAEEEQRLLGALEGVFPPGEASLTNQLNDFWNAWSTLANHPTDSGVRVALRGQATQLTDTFHRLSEDISGLQEEARATLGSSVNEVNGLLQQIADINVNAESSRIQGAPDLVGEDERDQLVKKLAEFGPVQVHEDPYKGFSVALNGMTVVEGKNVLGLELDTSGAQPQVVFKDTNVAYSATQGNDGKLGALVRTVNTTLPDAQAALDTLTNELVTEVNTLHSAGYGLDGATGRDFFDPSSLSAGTIQLSAAVQADSGVIAASGDATAQGDSTVALDIAGLRTQDLLNGGTETTEEFAVNLVTSIGSNLERVTSAAQGQAAIFDHLEALEKGVSGVSLDEEITNLIKFQQAFAASARIIETAQQMMDTILAI